MPNGQNRKIEGRVSVPPPIPEAARLEQTGSRSKRSSTELFEQAKRNPEFAELDLANLESMITSTRREYLDAVDDELHSRDFRAKLRETKASRTMVENAEENAMAAISNRDRLRKQLDAIREEARIRRLEDELSIPVEIGDDGDGERAA